MPNRQNEIAAATILDWKIDGQRPIQNEYHDGLFVTDTLPQKIVESTKSVKDTVLVTDTVYVKVRVPKRVTDTIYIQTANFVDSVAPVRNKHPGEKKFSPDEESLKLSKVSLYIDGKRVYSTDSVAPVEQPAIFSDGLKEP